jgi:RNA polymerase sigma factor (TIGR02999 family)
VTDPGEITILVRRFQAGDPAAGDELFKRLWPKLRRIAASYLRKERRNYTLRETELIHESFIKIIGGQPIDWRNQAHFLAIVSVNMFRILTDRGRRKRDHVPLVDLPGKNKLELSVMLNELLDALKAESPTKFNVVVFRSYLGCTTKETAQLLGLTEDVVEHEWYRGRKWLFEKLSQ